MNKIFKVIFNKTTGQFVVVSELSKAKGKASSSTDERVGVSSLVTKLQHQAKAALILGLLGVSSVAYAAEPAYGNNDGTGSPIAIGNGSNASGEGNIALGERSSATDTSKAKKQMIAIGGSATVTGSQAIAIGGDTRAEGYASISIGGDDADSTPYQDFRYNADTGRVEVRGTSDSKYQKTTASGGAAVAIGVKSQATRDGSVSLGVLATSTGLESTALGARSAAKGEKSVAIGSGATASGATSFAVADGALASGQKAMAVGKDSQATHADAVAIGVETNATNVNTLAVGSGARAQGDSSVALGKGALASKLNTTVLGAEAQALTNDAVAIGRGAVMDAGTGNHNGGLAIGKTATARGNGALAVGTSALAESTYAHAWGDTTRVKSERAIGVGLASTIETNSLKAVLVGGHSTIGANSAQSVLIGADNKVNSANAVAIGSGITIDANKSGSVAIGSSTSIGVEGAAIALGESSKADRVKNTVGYDVLSNAAYSSPTNETWSATRAALSVGDTSLANGSKITRQIIGVAAGTEDTDAVNVAQLKRAQVKVLPGENVTVVEDKSKGYTEYTISTKASKTEVDGTDGIIVTPTDIEGGKKYIAKLDPSIKSKLDSLPSNMNTVLNKLGVTNSNGDVKNDLGFQTVNGSDNNTAPTTVVGAINDVVTAVNKGISIQGNDSSAINKKLGQTFDIKGGLATNAEASNKNVRTQNVNSALEILIAEKPEFKEVTAGDNTGKTVIGSNGVTVKDSAGTDKAKLGTNKLEFTGNDGTITGLRDGTVAANSREAVTGNQLYEIEKLIGKRDASGNLTPNFQPSQLVMNDGSKRPDVPNNIQEQINDIVNNQNKGVIYRADIEGDIAVLDALKDKQELTEDKKKPREQYLGSTLNIKALADTAPALSKTGNDYTGTNFVGKNLVTKYEKDASGNGVVSIAMSEKPVFEEVKLNQDRSLTGQKASGTVTNPTQSTSGYGEGDNRNRAATEGAVKDLADKLGVSNTPEVSTGAAAKDGLDGKTISEKLDALRNGTAGNSVYTAPDGTRVVKNENGQYVKVGTDGRPTTEVVPNSDIVVSQVNPDGTTNSPIKSGNIASGLGLPSDSGANNSAITEQAAKDAINGTNGQDGLLTKTGAGLNNAATVKDLQALAQAGLDFTGNNANENQDVHRPLGSKLTIEGESTNANVTKTGFGETAKDNIHVESKKADNKLVISLSKDLKNLKTVTASDSIQVGTDANGVKITPTGTTTTKTDADGNKTEAVSGADGTSITGPGGKSAEYKLDGSKVTEVKNGVTKETATTVGGTTVSVTDATNPNNNKSAGYTAEGTTVKAKDAEGNDITTTVKADGVTATDKDSKNTVNADGMTVGPKDENQTDKSAATYDRDGVTVKGNDGADAIALTSKEGQDGKTTNTLALKGENGKDAVSITSGADGAAPEISFAKNGEDGTGSITGLKDVERNPDGTAKDKTQAANAGYVDDRLKEMNEGKPFEYFEKDPVTGEVKTETVDGKQVPVTLVRGKDGKFYKESDLKGKVFDPATNTYKNADGTPATLTEVASNNVTVQAMPSPTGKPLEMGNVGSGLGLDDSTTANATALTPEQAQTAIAGSGKDGKGGLLTKTGSSLNNVATVKDLQALAQAGLDFVGNETTTTAVHRPLGTKLVVQGETNTANQTLAQFGATAKDNIYVDTDATNNKLVVKMTEDLKNINSLTTKPVDNPDGTKISTKLTSTGTVVSKVDPAKLDADGKPTPVETANYGLTTELKKTDADGKVTTSTSAPTGTTLSEVDKDGNKLREAEYALDGTKVTLKDPVTGATKETTTGVDGTTVKVTDQNNPNNNKSAEYGVDGTALKAKDAQGNDISADYKVGGAMVKDKDNTTEIKPDGMTVKSTDEADKSEAKYGKDGLSIVGPKGKDGKDGISLGYKPDTDANGQLTGTSTPTLAFGKGEKDPDGNDKGTGSITGLKDVERNPDGTAKDRTAAANAGYVDERLAEANATKPLEYFGTDGKKLVLGQDGKFYKPEDLEGKVYVKRKDGTEGYFNREEKDNPTAKPVDLKNKAVDPQTVTIKAMPSDASNTPITMSNVGSGLGLKDDAESNKTALTPADAQKAIAGDNKDGKGGLLAQTGNALNNVATVKDLQAIAQAGLDFTGNNTATTVHRPLGTKLTVEGEGKWNGKDSAANNLYVEAQEADNKLVVKMNKDLTNLNSVTLGTATMTGKDNTINLTGAGAQVVEEFVKWDPVTKQPIRDKDGNLQKYTEKVDPRVKLSGIADGDISPNSTDAVNGRQVYALTNGNQVEQKKDGSTVTYAKDKDGSVITEVKRDKNGNPELDADGKEIVQPKEYKLTTYNVSEQQEFVTNSVITAVHNMNEQGIKFFHTNDGHNAEEQINQQSNTVDSSASGTYATAVGYKAVAAGDNALAMGKGATASGKNSIAIGTGNQVIANKSGAFGDPNIIRGVQIGTDSAGNPIYKGIDGSYAFGNDNVITSSNTFVLGNNVNNKRDSNGALTWMSAIPEGTVENSVYLGNNTTATAGDGSQTGSLKNWKQDGSRGSTTTAGSTGTVSSATVGNMIYGGFAGATANGVVSVGAAGDERRIQNVAAGEISSTSTDAINGSQLYNVAHRLGAKLESEGRQLRAGIAATTAMSNIPQVTLPGKSTLGAGIGTFEGQNAIAVGFSRMSDNGRVILKVSAGATSQGKYNAGAGIALQW
ncbi:YadA-like family protein [Glaesserella parasuis]|uniref:YadA-like family protein n=2 Tax=Glaesserella parasuis TaxID=738 RepID=UPI003B66EA78